MKSSHCISNLPVKLVALLALSLAAQQSVNAQIYDINTSGRNVFEYATSGGASLTPGTTPFISLNGYGASVAVASGELFVSQTGNSGDGGNGQDITAYNASTGAQILTFAGTGTITNLNNPEGMTVDGSSLFVANRTASTSSTAGSVVGYNIATGAPVLTISGLYQPTDVKAYNGNLYVTLNNGGGSGTAGTIEEFSEATGAQILTFNATGLGEPQGLTFDNGNLYATSEGTNSILEFNSLTGALLKSFAGPSNPYGITTLPNGDLLVGSDGPGSAVSEYDANGNLLSSNYLTGSSYVMGIAAAGSTTPIPEPSTWMLCILALLAFGAVTKLNRSRHSA